MRMIDRLSAAYRAFVLGPAVVPSWAVSSAFGQVASDDVNYGDYVVTSNAVYTCVTLRAELLASLPLRLYRVTQSGQQTEITGGDLGTLLASPNPWWTQSRLLSMTEMSLGLWGKAFWFLERGASGKGRARAIYWARGDCVTVVPDATGYVREFVYRPTWGAAELHFSPAETLWLRYPNPLDEFDGLSPMRAARLAADTASAAMKSNKAIFDNGMQPGGFILPPAGQTWTREQAEQLEQSLSQRFRGQDKRHRWAVLRTELNMQPAPVSPKDAEFLGAMGWALEDVCRAYKVPLDLIGGQRTYENVNAAMKALWTQCILPEADFIASEITLQLLPIFGGVDLAEFDHSKIDVLQEDRSEIVQQMQTLHAMGVPLNALLSEFQPTLLPDSGAYPWGDVWWAPVSVMPAGATPPALPAAETEQVPTVAATTATHARGGGCEYGSDEHRRLWQRFVRRTDAYVGKMQAVVVDHFTRERDSIIGKLKARVPRGTYKRDLLGDVFDVVAWAALFRDAVKPVLRMVVRDAGANALDDLGLLMAFDVDAPAVRAFIAARAQRFVEFVEATTWEQLKAAFVAHPEAGIPELAEIVEQVMGDRIRSSAETIARTEVIGGANGGTLEAWLQSEVVRGKRWLSTLDDRTRDTHAEAHGQEVGIRDDFQVGGARGPMPGQMGAPEEDCNCRCTATAVLDMGG